MPSDFGDSSNKSLRYYNKASIEQILNREFLQKIMEKHKFKGSQAAWWYFEIEEIRPLKQES